MKPVKLKDIIDGMYMQMDEFRVFLNKETGEIITVSTEELSIAENSEEGADFSEYPDWQLDSIKEALDVTVNWDKYVRLPDKFEVNEYNIMKEFCGSIWNKRISDTLCCAIRGRGAFRRFKDTIIHLGVEEDWYKFREEAFREIAVRWCEDNAIKYMD